MPCNLASVLGPRYCSVSVCSSWKATGADSITSSSSSMPCNLASVLGPRYCSISASSSSETCPVSSRSISRTRRPSSTASAIICATSFTERIASSLPGMIYVISSGSELVSATASRGMPILFASLTANSSRWVSITKIRLGILVRVLIPPMRRFSLAISRSMTNCSILGSDWNSPLALRRS